jgi:hypothetical protein
MTATDAWLSACFVCHLRFLRTAGPKVSRDRDREISQCYRLIDSELRGISAADLQRLSTAVGGPVSLDYAQAMIAASLKETGDSNSSTRVSEANFRSLLMPK